MATILLDFCILYLETIPFRYRDRLKKVKNVKYYSFSLCSEFTPSLFYRLKHKLLILNNIQILKLQQLERCILPC